MINFRFGWQILGSVGPPNLLQALARFNGRFLKVPRLSPCEVSYNLLSRGMKPQAPGVKASKNQVGNDTE